MDNLFLHNDSTQFYQRETLAGKCDINITTVKYDLYVNAVKKAVGQIK